LDATPPSSEEESSMSDDIKTHDPASRATEKDYTASDVESVMRVRQWRDWDEVISWLREEGDDHRRLTPGEVKHMVEDFTRLKEQGAPFTTDPQQLYEQAHKARSK
jgi:hypothetical protein